MNTALVSKHAWGEAVFFPWAASAISDGWVQLHTYKVDGWRGNQYGSGHKIMLMDASNNIILMLTPTLNCYQWNPTWEVYTGPNESGLTLRGSFSGLSVNSWHTLSIGYKPATSGGYVKIAVDGVTYSFAGNMGTNAPWVRLATRGSYQCDGGIRNFPGGILMPIQLDTLHFSVVWTETSSMPELDGSVAHMFEQLSDTVSGYADHESSAKKIKRCQDHFSEDYADNSVASAFDEMEN